MQLRSPQLRRGLQLMTSLQLLDLLVTALVGQLAQLVTLVRMVVLVVVTSSGAAHWTLFFKTTKSCIVRMYE
jgi:hypothetical protein